MTLSKWQCLKLSAAKHTHKPVLLKDGLCRFWSLQKQRVRVVGARASAELTKLLPRLERIIDSMESQEPMPSDALRDLKLVRQYLQNR